MSGFLPEVTIFPTPEMLAERAAHEFARLSQASIELHGRFSVALSGGSTPQAMYAHLAEEPLRSQVDWGRVYVFWGDERCVPPDSPQSNYGNARSRLLQRVPIPEGNIYRIPAEMEPQKAARQYEETLLRYFGALELEEDRERAAFDLVLLGMGDEGHTASLFPGTLAVSEPTHWVSAEYVEKLSAWRISLTPALFNRAAQVLFLVAGANKASTLVTVLYGSDQPERYPAQSIRPNTGRLRWWVDEAAASTF